MGEARGSQGISSLVHLVLALRCLAEPKTSGAPTLPCAILDDGDFPAFRSVYRAIPKASDKANSCEGAFGFADLRGSRPACLNLRALVDDLGSSGQKRVVVVSQRRIDGSIVDQIGREPSASLGPMFSQKLCQVL